MNEVSPDAWTDLPGRLIVVSGPSGSGKSTILRRVLEHPEVRARFSISATSRAPRPGEEHGRHYLFLSREQFEAARDRGEFLEWAEVHGNLYGTPAAPVRDALTAGECVILEIDVQGAAQIIRAVPTAVSVFINVPSLEVLEARLRARQTDDDPTIERRLANARRELEQIAQYQHVIVNQDLDQAVSELVAILNQRRCGG